MSCYYYAIQIYFVYITASVQTFKFLMARYYGVITCTRSFFLSTGTRAVAREFFITVSHHQSRFKECGLTPAEPSFRKQAPPELGLGKPADLFSRPQGVPLGQVRRGISPNWGFLLLSFNCPPETNEVFQLN